MFKLNILQKELLENARINGKEKYISFPTGCGKTIASILLARKLFGKEKKVVITPSQPLTFSWGFEMHKRDITKNNYNVSCTYMEEVDCNINAFPMINAKGEEITIRTIDYLSDMSRVRKLIKNKQVIIFDEYDSYSPKMIELVLFIKRYYAQINALDRLIFVSATGEKKMNLLERFIPVKNKYEEVSSIIDTQQNIIIRDAGSASKNFIFETYFHLEGNEYGYHSRVLHVEERVKTNMRNSDIETYSTLRGYDSNSSWCQAMYSLLNEEVVTDTIIQNHLGVGVDWNTDSLEINWSQFTRYNSPLEVQTQLIQRMGRVNRNSKEETAYVEIIQGNLEKVYECLTQEFSSEEIFTSVNENGKKLINSYINRGKFNLRPFIINVEIDNKFLNKIVKSAFYTYDELLFSGWDRETIQIEFGGNNTTFLKEIVENTVLEKCLSKKEKIQKIILRRREELEKKIKAEKTSALEKKFNLKKGRLSEIEKEFNVEIEEIDFLDFYINDFYTFETEWRNVLIKEVIESTKNKLKKNMKEKFVPLDWKIEQTDTAAHILKYIGSNASVYIPGEFDFGGNIGIKPIKIRNIDLGGDIKAIKIAEVNGKKVNFIDPTQERVFVLNEKTMIFDARGLETKDIEDMSSAFRFASGLLEINLSGINTSNVKKMIGMFKNLSWIKEINLRGLDTSNVKNMKEMFSCNIGLTSLDVSGFDTSNVTDMSSMFHGASGLTSLDVSGFDTSKVADMNWMFSGATSLEYLDLTGFDMSEVMFKECMVEGVRQVIGLK